MLPGTLLAEPLCGIDAANHIFIVLELIDQQVLGPGEIDSLYDGVACIELHSLWPTAEAIDKTVLFLSDLGPKRLPPIFKQKRNIRTAPEGIFLGLPDAERGRTLFIVP